jgi:hypothetical protein
MLCISVFLGKHWDSWRWSCKAKYSCECEGKCKQITWNGKTADKAYERKSNFKLFIIFQRDYFKNAIENIVSIFEILNC